MKKIIYYLTILLLTISVYSCKINVGDDDKENGNENWNENEEFFFNPQPLNGQIEVSLTPMLNWSYNSGSTSINFEVFLDTINPPFQHMGTVYTNSYTVTTPLKGNTMYYWRIRSYFEGTNYESSVWRFTTTTGGIPTNGLIAYYPFNGNANDESGNGNNGLVYNATLTTDRFYNSDKAYYFSGINSYIVVQHNSILNPLNAITLSAWVSLDNLNNNAVILGKGEDTIPGWYSLLYRPSYQSLCFEINNGFGFTLGTGNQPSVYTWYNIVGTFDGSYISVYLNGQYKYKIYLAGSLKSNDFPLIIGNSTNGYSLAGKVDDIRIYDRALSENEIQMLYNESKK